MIGKKKRKRKPFHSNPPQTNKQHSGNHIALKNQQSRSMPPKGNAKNFKYSLTTKKNAQSK
jgi:hypothetical protein